MKNGNTRAQLIAVLLVVVLAGVFLYQQIKKALNDVTLMQKQQVSIASNPSKAIFSGEEVVYDHGLELIADPKPILAQYPKFVSQITEPRRYLAKPLVVDSNASINVRTWFYSYNHRGIIEMNNQLDGRQTAVLVVHPWGIDNDQGFYTPGPNGSLFFGTPEKNKIYLEHTREVLEPFLQKIRSQVALVGFSLPGPNDSLRPIIYPSSTKLASKEERDNALQLFNEKASMLAGQTFTLSSQLSLPENHLIKNYFLSLEKSRLAKMSSMKSLWEVLLVANTLSVQDLDVVFYDTETYSLVRDNLKKRGIKNILLCGYSTDMCLVDTLIGYKNLQNDFNVFIVGDATLATFPAMEIPNEATKVALANASLNHLITEISWIEPLSSERTP